MMFKLKINVIPQNFLFGLRSRTKESLCGIQLRFPLEMRFRRFKLASG